MQRRYRFGRPADLHLGSRLAPEHVEQQLAGRAAQSRSGLAASCGEEDDFDTAVRAPIPVLVDLWAPWCAPCRTVAPGVERAATELAGRLKVVKVNVDDAPGISARFGVQGIPTLLLLRDGELVARQVGALPTDRLVAWVRGVVDAAV